MKKRLDRRSFLQGLVVTVAAVGPIAACGDDSETGTSGGTGGEGGALFAAGQRVAAALRSSGLRCEGVNLRLADGEAAGQEVFHVHLHVIPRFAGDGFGLTFGPAYGQLPPRAELDALAEQLRGRLT